MAVVIIIGIGMVCLFSGAVRTCRDQFGGCPIRIEHAGGYGIVIKALIWV